MTFSNIETKFLSHIFALLRFPNIIHNAILEYLSDFPVKINSHTPRTSRQRMHRSQTFSQPLMKPHSRIVMLTRRQNLEEALPFPDDVVCRGKERYTFKPSFTGFQQLFLVAVHQHLYTINLSIQVNAFDQTPLQFLKLVHNKIIVFSFGIFHSRFFNQDFLFEISVCVLTSQLYTEMEINI